MNATGKGCCMNSRLDHVSINSVTVEKVSLRQRSHRFPLRQPGGNNFFLIKGLPHRDHRASRANQCDEIFTGFTWPRTGQHANSLAERLRKEDARLHRQVESKLGGL